MGHKEVRPVASPLYALVEREKVLEMLTTFRTLTDLPIQVVDTQGAVLEGVGRMPRFCRMLDGYRRPQDNCALLHARAGIKAASLGESYIFACPAGLSHIAFPLLYLDECFGTILTGPFLMDAPDSILMREIAKKYSVPAEELIDLYEESAAIRIVPPDMVNSISRLLYYLFSGLIQSSLGLLRYNQGQLSQQARISEAIQAYKSFDQPQDAYPYEKEKELIAQVKAGKAARAKALLNDLLGYVFFSQGNSLENIKLRTLELCSLLSRAAIEGGAATDSTLKMNNQFLKSLQQISTLEQLCYELQQIVDLFCNNMFDIVPSRSGELVKRAMQFIYAHFSTDLTLDEVAAHVHLNPSYFSSVFKKACGSSFKEYLNMVRVEEAKRLLGNTSYAILDIAVAVGFEDQSYFSKVFKRICGLSPKQFRK